MSRVVYRIDLRQLQENFAVLKRLAGNCRLMPVLKADAYGMGALRIGAALKSAGAVRFGAATLDEALELNRKLWTFFLSEICDERNPLPREIKQNIFNLAHFIFKHTFAIQANPKAESLDILININMNIARGLNEQSKLRKEQTATPSTSQNA